MQLIKQDSEIPEKKPFLNLPLPYVLIRVAKFVMRTNEVKSEMSANSKVRAREANRSAQNLNILKMKLNKFQKITSKKKISV